MRLFHSEITGKSPDTEMNDEDGTGQKRSQM